MKTKTITLCLALAIAAVFCVFAGCSNGDDLPTGIGEVGGTIEHEDDMLPSTDITFNTPNVSPDDGDNADGDGESAVRPEARAAVDEVKSWYEDIVSGSYSETVDEEFAYISRDTAPMTNGGRLSIVIRDGYYNMTEARFALNGLDLDALKENVSEVTAAYIGRRLTVNETEALGNAIDAALSGPDVANVPELENAVSVTLMVNADDLLVQLR